MEKQWLSGRMLEVDAVIGNRVRLFEEDKRDYVYGKAVAVDCDEIASRRIYIHWDDNDSITTASLDRGLEVEA